MSAAALTRDLIVTHTRALKLPGVDIPANVGPAHRQHCLTALAMFQP